MATDASNCEQILQYLVNRFIDIQVSLQCTLEDLRNLVGWREKNNLVFDFDNKTGNLTSVDERPPANRDEEIFRAENADFREPCIEDLKIFCKDTAELVTERVESLAQTRLDIDQALSKLPKELLKLLSGIRGNIWPLHVRRFCLMPLDYWSPLFSRELHHPVVLVGPRRVRIPTRLDELLEFTKKEDPQKHWQSICRRIDTYIDDILAIATEVNVKVVRRIKPDPKTIKIIRAIQKDASNEDLAEQFDIGASNARKIRCQYENDQYEL